MQTELGYTYIGIDLAAKPSRCTGFVAISSCGKLCIVEAKCLGSDDEIVSSVAKYRRAIVAIDAPLGFGNGFIRNVDRKMIAHGYKVLPPGLPQMALLTRRAINIAERVRGMGYTVIETHPTSVLKSSGCGSVEELAKALNIMNVDIVKGGKKDIVDAFLAAVAALCYNEKCSEVIEDTDGAIWLVKRLCKS